MQAPWVDCGIRQLSAPAQNRFQGLLKVRCAVVALHNASSQCVGSRLSRPRSTARSVRSLSPCGAAGEAGHALRRLDEGIELVYLKRCVEFGQKSVHEPKMDRAHHLRMFLCHLSEGAAMQQHLAPAAPGNRFGGEPDVLHRADQAPSRLVGIHSCERRRALAEVATPFPTRIDGCLLYTSDAADE